MGTLRLLLAWLVIISHSSPILGWRGIGGDAVTAFFIISGFYMALILDSKYRNGLWLFYTNRALRLFPLYFFFLAVYVLLASIGQHGSVATDRVFYMAEQALLYATDGSIASLLAAVPNLLFLGSDVIRLYLFDASTNSFELWRTGMVETAELRGGYRFLVMPHIWSLGVELVFYAFVPFVAVLRLPRLVLLFAVLFAVQQLMALLREEFVWLHLLSLWNLAYFVLGILAFRLAAAIKKTKRAFVLLLAALPFAVAVLTPGSYWLVWVPFAVGLPALFFLTKDVKFDKALGELSYPVYLCHFLLAWPAAAAFGASGSIVALIGSCALSWVAIRLVDRPIENWRQYRVAQARSQPIDSRPVLRNQSAP